MARFRRDAEAHDGHHYAVRYESLLDDAAGEMQRLFRWFGCDASEATVAAVVGRNAFAVASGGRQPGEADPQSFLRKGIRSEEHTSELQSLMRISYAVFCLKKNNKQ